MIERIKALLAEVENLQAQNAEELEALRIKYLSKKGEINALMGDFRNVAAESKREVGKYLNELKESAQNKINELNAVLTGVADIRTAIKQAEDFYSLYSRRTILFVDEVHRWNKAQQDALLPWVENGTIILIGATTENPFFEVNKALVSRSRVFQLKPLTNDDLRKAAEQALGDKERGYGKWKDQSRLSIPTIYC